MKRFKNILLVYGDQVGGDEALSLAAGLAASNNARLTIMDALGDTEATPAILDERRKRLDRLLTSVANQCPNTASMIACGIPFIDISRQVLRDNHDLVVMAADSVEGLKRMLFGSTSMHLMRKCPCPVWVLKPNQSQHYRNVLAAVAYPASELERDELNIKILDLATSLARSEGSKLHVVHAWDFTGADADTMRSETTPALRDRLTEKHESSHRAWMSELLGRYSMSGIDLHQHLARGRSAAVITQISAEKQVDLVVMGTVCRTGIPGFFIGNTAESVLNQVDCSVLTVKPAGFVTPIALEG